MWHPQHRQFQRQGRRAGRFSYIHHGLKMLEEAWRRLGVEWSLRENTHSKGCSMRNIIWWSISCDFRICVFSHRLWELLDISVRSCKYFGNLLACLLEYQGHRYLPRLGCCLSTILPTILGSHFHVLVGEDIADQERQFHTVTEIVRKHRETAKNKMLGKDPMVDVKSPHEWSVLLLICRLN